MTQNMKIIDSNGVEIECEVISLFKDSKMGFKYIAYTEDIGKEEQEILVAKYEEDEGTIKMVPITSTEEWEFIDDFFEKELFAGDEDE